MQAVELLRRGSLVALPTETVYGLAGNAEDLDAIARIFALKGRPATHPLIVHLAGAALDAGVGPPDSPDAQTLAAAFWPGPPCLCSPAAPGRRTDHGRPANRRDSRPRAPAHASRPARVRRCRRHAVGKSFRGHVSATTAAAVAEEFGAEVPVLDGGPCAIGLESTIIDRTRPDPAVLRPGAIDCAQLSAALGRRVTFASGDGPRVSGSVPSHYAPRAAVEIVAAGAAPQRLAALRAGGANAVWITGDDPVAFARDLYEALRDADRRGADVAIVSPPDGGALGPAIADRLRRASAPR